MKCSKRACLGIEQRYEVKFLEIGIDKDHAHFLVQSVPGYSVTKVVRIIKIVTASEIFKRCPQGKKTLWGGEFWTDGYFVSTVGKHRDEGKIGKYVKNQGNEYRQLQGTPQGGPLSPLLSNVLLDEVDKALEKRGHRFARYADDCNVYVRSQKAGERVFRFLRKLYAKLHLRVNEKKAEVGPVFGRKFLGYCLRRLVGDTVKIAVAPKGLEKFKERIREITTRNGGRNIAQVAEQLRKYMPGWRAYFRLAQTPKEYRDLDSWIRRRLRAIQLKLWKRGATIYRELRSLGAVHEVAVKVAAFGAHWWRASWSDLHRVLTVSYFDGLGIPRLI